MLSVPEFICEMGWEGHVCVVGVGGAWQEGLDDEIGANEIGSISVSQYRNLKLILCCRYTIWSPYYLLNQGIK